MKDIIIDISDFEYLVKNIPDKDVVDIIKSSSEQKFNSFYLSIDKYTCEKILDFLGNTLTKSGFKDDDEPSDFGIYIENLIDKFSVAFYDGDS